MSRKKEDKFVELTPTEAAHDTVRSLYDIGLVDAQTMKTFDAICLPNVKDLNPTQIKKLRLREKASQSVFAKCLNISASTVRQWELGDKHPSGASLKLLNLVHDKGLGALI